MTFSALTQVRKFNKLSSQLRGLHQTCSSFLPATTPAHHGQGGPCQAHATPPGIVGMHASWSAWPQDSCQWTGELTPPCLGFFSCDLGTATIPTCRAAGVLTETTCVLGPSPASTQRAAQKEVRTSFSFTGHVSRPVAAPRGRRAAGVPHASIVVARRQHSCRSPGPAAAHRACAAGSIPWPPTREPSAPGRV